MLAPETLEKITATLNQVETSLHLLEWDQELTLAVQTALVALKFLSSPQAIDGITGPNTRKAWAEFKASVHQAEPEFIGGGSAQLLLDALGVPHPVPTEVPTETPQVSINVNAGLKTGIAKPLPYYNTLVYANEYILPDIPLTWGECTKNMSRWPTQKLEVDNGRRLAQVFGEVRKHYGAPLIITSAFRPEPINRQVGGARYSQHIPFKALDIRPLDSNFDKLLHILRNTPSVVGIGLGQRKGFLHMDIRNGRRVEWPY